MTSRWTFLRGPSEMQTETHLMARAPKISSSSATGPDGRSPSELRSIPLWIWEEVAKVFALIFLEGKQWPPTLLLKAHVVFTPKNNDGH